MPSLSERQRNNVKAGVFVTISLLLALGVLIVLTDAVDLIRRRTMSYTVVFDIASGVPNIKRGSQVRVGGVSMGRVTAIEPRLAPGTKTLQEIAVKFELDRRATLFNDAQILVTAPLIGSEGWLDIPNVGMVASGEATGEIPGTASSGLLSNLLGGRNKTRADEIVDNAVEFTEFLAQARREYDSRIVPMLEDVKATTADARAVVGDLRGHQWPTWSAHVNDVMEWASSVPAKIDAAVAEGTGLLTDARAIVAENREPVRNAVANVEQVTDRVKAETVDKVHALLETGQEGIDAAVATLKDLQVDYASWATDLGETVGSAAIASQQLKLATIEVRRSPWKLLYRPTSEELEHELLYEAARSFAVAAADIKAASASVQRAMDHSSPELLRDAEAFQRLQQNLTDSLDRYEKAQQRLLDVIIADQPGP